MEKLRKQAFTLIELLVVIAIMSMNNSAGLF
ncbi:MAG: prepilin-type N-terminal cleavage/methylation domain-containing protein [Verrucomicrobiota bacterium]|jgi:prepilin-type N-terminal cleavage/methylation domain-containing protein|nr:prepilin-type N-terminal cleavage/methylation domain-containing protein [Verrucomicrobiota bacterium]